MTQPRQLGPLRPGAGLVGMLALVAGCGLPSVRIPKEAERYEFEAGRIALDHRQYLEAQNHLKRFLDLHPGHAAADSAQYLLGLAQYGSRSYAEAAVEFNILVREFPRSELRDDAAYQECLAYFAQMRPPQLDPTQAERSRSCLNSFLLAYPDSPQREAARARLQEIADRLAEKEFHLGRQFAKFKQYEAALIYLDVVLVEYPSSRWVPEALLWKGRCLQKLGRLNEAAETFQRLVESYPEHRAASEARARLQGLQSSVGGVQSPEQAPEERAARQPQ